MMDVKANSRIEGAATSPPLQPTPNSPPLTMLPLRVRHPEGVSTIQIDETLSTISDLLAAISSATGLPSSSLESELSPYCPSAQRDSSLADTPPSLAFPSHQSRPATLRNRCFGNRPQPPSRPSV